MAESGGVPSGGALTKADIAEKLFFELELDKRIGFTKRDAKHLVELFFEEICAALENGHYVKLSGFGNFYLRDKGERPGRNPKTGESIPVRARRVVTFRPGQKLRTRIEHYQGPSSVEEE